MTLGKTSLRGPVQGNSSKELTGDAEQRDAAVVVAIAPVTLFVIKGDNVSISHALWHSTFHPAHAEQLVEFVKQSRFPTLEDFGCYPITAWY